MDITINSNTTSVELTNSGTNSVEISQQSIGSPTISVQDGNTVSLVNSTPLSVDILNTRLISGGSSDLTIADLLAKADLAVTANFTYTDGNLGAITYSDYDGISSNSKTLTYTGGNLSELAHSFVYSSVTWTVTKTFTYVNGVLTTKNTNIINA